MIGALLAELFIKSPNEQKNTAKLGEDRRQKAEVLRSKSYEQTDFGYFSLSPDFWHRRC